MVAALAPRGPDDRGTWIAPDGRCVLGHTRLAIIDLDASRQPMTSEDGSLVLTYNGEIYNYRDLRRWLTSRGHRFRTAGDTEVLIHLYEEQGADMVRALDGMFAFALYDRRRHRLLLARDRIGIKPLSYAALDGGRSLIFASDTGALLASGLLSRRLHPQALGQYLRFGYAVHPTGWLREARQVEPGQTLRWQDGAMEARRYYTWAYSPRDELGSTGTARERLEETLAASTERQLVADVPLGSFLSGGLDSTSVAGFAQRARRRSGDALRSFTVRFGPAEYDESQRAGRIAAALGTAHAEVRAEALRFDRPTLDRIVAGLGEPFGDTSLLAVYLLCREVRASVKVALSGDGGDELFIGYVGLRKQLAARRLRLAPAGLRRLAAARLAGSRGPWSRRARRALDLSLAPGDPHVIVEWARRWEESDLAALLAPDLHDAAVRDPDALAGVYAAIGDGARGGFLEQQIRFHMLVDLPCDCLVKVDRMSMAHGLEVRVPMLGNAMLDYAAGLPLGARRLGGRTKEPLRTVAERLVPALAQPAPKHGFGFPVRDWLGAGVRNLWRAGDLSSVLARAGFRRPALDALLDGAREDPGGAMSHARAARLFDLTVLAVWMDRHGIAA
jgi:asparagine synthase (glutamine-hydrolysing)